MQTGHRCRATRYVLAAWMTLCLFCGVALGGGRTAQLADLLPRLAQRAALYEETALRFACEEEVTETRFDGKEGIKKQVRTIHDYLLEYTKRGGLRPYRAVLSKNDKSVDRHKVDPEYGTPNPYAWQLLFVEGGQGRFEFDLTGQEFVNPHDTWVIKFTALASYSTGSRIGEWEGTLWVDQDSLDILEVRARPSKEVDTLEARMAEYRQAFRILGLSTKKRPRARFLRVEFDIEREGLRFPSRSMYTIRSGPDLEAMRVESSIVQRFSDYVFFDVESLDKFRAMQTPRP